MARRAPVAEFLGREEAVYSEPRLWQKLSRSALAAGREVVEKALWLYYASQRPDVPRWARATIYAALAYFVLPLDAIPDITPLTGYADDLAALSAALLTVAAYVDDAVKEKARERMQHWFGAAAPRSVEH